MGNRTCEGCGSQLQMDDPSRPGYLPPKAFSKETMLCQRCFRIRHYGDVTPVAHDPEVYARILDDVGEAEGLVVLVVDLFDFSGSWIPGLHRRIGRNPLLLVANKLDLFPASTRKGRLREWVRRSSREMGIEPVDVLLCSAAKGWQIDQVMASIERHRRGQDVYIIGTTNVGKSTLVNRIIQDAGGGGGRITTSPYPGTTLDRIQIPLDDGRAIIDTPGIVRKDRLIEWVSPKDLRAISPKVTLRPKVYQLNEKQTLFFGGFARFDFVQGPRQSFVFYVANELSLHRTKLEKADAVWASHRGGLLSPPEDWSQLPKWKRHVFHFSGQQKEDLVVAGLGWVTGGTERAEVILWAPEGIQIELRPAVI